MAKVKIENDVRPYESNSQWKKDLLSLMCDLCVTSVFHQKLHKGSSERQKRKLLPVNHAVRYTEGDGESSEQLFSVCSHSNER